MKSLLLVPGDSDGVEVVATNAEVNRGLVMPVTQVTFLDSDTWVAPPGVTSVTAECWGGGGAGSTEPDLGGGGGGGGQYARRTMRVTPGVIYSVEVGLGGLDLDGNGGASQFNNEFSDFCIAQGGQVGADSSGGLGGGEDPQGNGTVLFNGGRGADAGFLAGGGGGSSGGPESDGTMGSPGTGAGGGSGGVAPAGGGDGGNGGATGHQGQTPSARPGGGGGGGGSGITSASNGAAGKVRLSWTTQGVFSGVWWDDRGGH